MKTPGNPQGAKSDGYQEGPDLTELARAIEKLMTTQLLMRPGFVMIFTSPHEDGKAHWMSNVKRDDALRLIEAQLAQLNPTGEKVFCRACGASVDVPKRRQLEG